MFCQLLLPFVSCLCKSMCRDMGVRPVRKAKWLTSSKMWPDVFRCPGYFWPTAFDKLGHTVSLSCTLNCKEVRVLEDRVQFFLIYSLDLLTFAPPYSHKNIKDLVIASIKHLSLAAPCPFAVRTHTFSYPIQHFQYIHLFVVSHHNNSTSHHMLFSFWRWFFPSGLLFLFYPHIQVFWVGTTVVILVMFIYWPLINCLSTDKREAFCGIASLL